MASDDRNELERLRRQLEAVTAERDRLLAENSRLLQTTSESLGVSPPDFNSALGNASIATQRATEAVRAINDEAPLPDLALRLQTLASRHKWWAMVYERQNSELRTGLQLGYCNLRN